MSRLTDGHLRLGVGAGDHAVLLWPLLCGMAKAKYYLLTADLIDGREAERIGLVSRCVASERVLDEALLIAERVATGPRQAARFTKRTLNHWLRSAFPRLRRERRVRDADVPRAPMCARAPARLTARSANRGFGD